MIALDVHRYCVYMVVEFESAQVRAFCDSQKKRERLKRPSRGKVTSQCDELEQNSTRRTVVDGFRGGHGGRFAQSISVRYFDRSDRLEKRERGAIVQEKRSRSEFVQRTVGLYSETVVGFTDSGNRFAKPYRHAHPKGFASPSWPCRRRVHWAGAFPSDYKRVRRQQRKTNK